MSGFERARLASLRSMPRNIGPDMITNLEQQRLVGTIDQATYEARKVEVLEVIRKGEAIVFERREKALWGTVAALFTGLGALMLLGVIGGGNLVTVLIAAGMLWYGLDRLTFILRH
jgi:hypothetical protein